MNPDYDYLWKVVIVGDSGVGKSCLLLRFADETYTQSYISTIGVEFKIVYLSYKGKTIKYQAWDTVGDNKLVSTEHISNYYRGPHGIIIVYDVTDKISFEQAKLLPKKYSDFYKTDLSMVLVGNKCDAEHKRVISTEEGETLADELGIPFIETSALTGENVDNIFKLMTNVVLARIDNHGHDKFNYNKQAMMDISGKCAKFSSTIKIVPKTLLTTEDLITRHEEQMKSLMDQHRKEMKEIVESNQRWCNIM